MRLQTASTACRVRAALTGRAGQGTVETALVLFAFVALLAGLAALWRMAGDGKLVEHALLSASHHIAGATGAWADVFAY